MLEYFRIEATELIARMTASLRAIASGQEVEPQWRDLQRAAHTLKGAAHVVRQTQMAATAHDLEDTIAERSSDKATSLVDRLAEMLEALFAIPAAAVEKQPDTAPAAAVTQEAEEELPSVGHAETVRVDLDSTNRLLASITQSRVHLSALVSSRDDLAELCVRVTSAVRLLRNGSRSLAAQELIQAETKCHTLQGALKQQLSQMANSLDEVEDLAEAMRLAPVQPMFLRVERAARRTAEQLAITVHCELEGVEERLDLHLITEVEEALSHMARNAVAHGLRNRGGTVWIGLRRRGSLVEFYCRDDGAGIEIETIREQAVVRGWMKAEDAKSASRGRLLELLARPGVTTRTQADETAGRGIGLNVVRSIARRLRGQMMIESGAGEGTIVSLRLPEDLFAIPAVVVGVGDMEFALPLSAVEQTIVPNGHRNKQRPFGKEIVLGGELVPVLDTVAVTGAWRGLSSGRVAVLVQTNSGRAALPVDRVRRMEELVTEAVPAQWQAKPWIAGTYRDSSGQPRILLDPTELVAAEFQPSTSLQEGREAPRILIIDDSLTSRMLQEGILSAAGYAVDTASSAEDGLSMAEHADYSLFLVDVEMPGMDGFGFVETTRRNAALRQTPVIMVTSRNRPGDREHGLRLGASEYVVKGSFDQDVLLAAVARLTAGRTRSRLQGDPDRSTAGAS